jgi:lipopolysaccharide biosynthesis glycosyltransferase
MMNIFFCADTHAIEGLGITLVSIIRNCSYPECLKIWILCSNTTPKDKENINLLLIHEKFNGKITFIDFDADKSFDHFRFYPGNKMMYGRLMIPTLLKTGYAYYFDCDLVVNLDILELQNYISTEIIGAVERRKFNDDNVEKKLLVNKLHLDPNASYFNSGLLIINVEKWHLEKVFEKLSEIGLRYAKDLVYWDQTMLNIVCNGNYNQIPQKFNMGSNSHKELTIKNTQDQIIHFGGLPKPWDIWGKRIRSGYSLWQVYETPYWKYCYGKVTKNKIKVLWKKRRIYVLTLLKMTVGDGMYTKIKYFYKK